MQKAAEYISNVDLDNLLSHPDAFVRSLADWTREFRGQGTRNLLASEYAAEMYQQRLVGRLRRLAELGLQSSPKSTL